jgi:hypothetical protein
MINLANFSLARTPVTVQRYRGGFSKGVFSYTLERSFQIQASVQPYKTIEDQQIFEPDAGEWNQDIRIMFSREKIYINDNNSADSPRDILIILGEKFKAVRSEVWLHLSEPHYRTILRNWDGD